MLTIIILFILFIGAYSGYKNGSILELFKAIGYIISVIVSFGYYKKVSSILELMVPYPSPRTPDVNPYHFYDKKFMFILHQSFYYIISVLIIFMIGWVVVQFLAKIISYTLENVEVPEPINSLIGAIIGFFIKYIAVFYLLFFFSLIPLSIIQDNMAKSFLAEKILISTPFISKGNYNRFIVDVNKEVEENNPIIDAEDPLEAIEFEEDVDEEENVEEDE